MIDQKQLLAMTGGDADLAEEVLGIFVSQAEVWGRLLNPDLAQQEWADAAHTIKGAALSIGANELAEICKEAETLGRGEDCSKVEAATVLSDVKSALNLALEASARVRHSLATAGFKASKERNS